MADGALTESNSLLHLNIFDDFRSHHGMIIGRIAESSIVWWSDSQIPRINPVGSNSLPNAADAVSFSEEVHFQGTFLFAINFAKSVHTGFLGL
jgi:hypothetical protein